MIPLESNGNVAARRELIRAARASREIQRALLRHCKSDIFFFTDLFVWQTNPRHVGAEPGPFITHEFQRLIVKDTIHRLLVERRSAVWEKSR